MRRSTPKCRPTSRRCPCPQRALFGHGMRQSTARGRPLEPAPSMRPSATRPGRVRHTREAGARGRAWVTLGRAGMSRSRRGRWGAGVRLWEKRKKRESSLHVPADNPGRCATDCRAGVAWLPAPASSSGGTEARREHRCKSPGAVIAGSWPDRSRGALRHLLDADYPVDGEVHRASLIISSCNGV